MRKGDMSRWIMLQEQSRRDGREIAHLSAANRWLARQLAKAGARPCYTPDAGLGAEDVARLADEWLATAERFGAEHYGRQAKAQAKGVAR